MSSKKVLLISAFILLCSSILLAKPADSIQAQKAVKGWLKLDYMPFKTAVGRQVGKADIYTDVNDEPIYYIVYLRPSGFVIVPADDEIEPIIGFVAEGEYDPSPENPLGALVSRDLTGRIAAVHGMANAPDSFKKTERDVLNKHFEKAKTKWAALKLSAESVTPLAGISTVSDIRVSPRVQSQWNQNYSCYYPQTKCYNIYTPNNYVCGCVATAMAQLMRFHRCPTGSLTRQSFTIKVDDVDQQAYLLGGNGSGGPYDYNQMPLVPGCSATQTQREAIGRLCSDAGVSVNMNYASGASSASVKTAKDQLLSVFGYSNAVYALNYPDTIGDGLNAMINPNLDANFPVLLGIYGPSGGHAILADGYGYNAATLYHHLNMGWGGSDDAWYNLPNINAYYTFNIVDECVYNIYATGSGEIISGRVTTSSGAPVSGVAITAQAPGTSLYTATTNSNGIYAIAKVPKTKTYTVTASKAGMAFLPHNATTGNSTDWETISGNVWAVDFIDTSSNPPLTGDFGLDGKVDFKDFATIASAWMTHSGDAKWNPACDISTPADSFINFRDFAAFADNWLQGT